MKKYKLLSSIFYNLSNKIISVSEGVKQDILNNTFINKNKIITIYNPVPDHGYRIKNIINKKFTLVTVGKLKSQKNHILLCNSINLLNDNIKKNIILHIVGDGELENNLKNYIKSNQLGEIINLVGYKSDPMKFVTNCDLFVLSSDYEGLPTVLIEAMYTGIYILSTDCPHGPKEILCDYPNSLLVPIKDPLILSKSIEKIYLEKKIKNSVKIEFNKFDPEIAYVQYHSLVYEK